MKRAVSSALCLVELWVVLWESSWAEQWAAARVDERDDLKAVPWVASLDSQMAERLAAQ